MMSASAWLSCGHDPCNKVQTKTTTASATAIIERCKQFHTNDALDNYLSASEDLAVVLSALTIIYDRHLARCRCQLTRHDQLQPDYRPAGRLRIERTPHRSRK